MASQGETGARVARPIDLADLTPEERRDVLECIRAEIDSVDARARRTGALTDEQYRYRDSLADAQVKLRLAAGGV